MLIDEFLQNILNCAKIGELQSQSRQILEGVCGHLLLIFLYVQFGYPLYPKNICRSTEFENHRKSLIQHLHYEFTKVL